MEASTVLRLGMGRTAAFGWGGNTFVFFAAGIITLASGRGSVKLATQSSSCFLSSPSTLQTLFRSLKTS